MVSGDRAEAEEIRYCGEPGQAEGDDRTWQAQYPQRDIVPTQAAMREVRGETNPYDNWPRYSQWWPETDKEA